VAEDAEPVESPRDRWIEVLATVLLALAAVAIAWATYQAAHWRSEQALAGNRSTAARVEANQAAGVANRQIQVDVETFINGSMRSRWAIGSSPASTFAVSGRSFVPRSRRGWQRGLSRIQRLR
jgi:hypothetical protein